MYNRKHFPGCVRPARPARCLAAACEMGVTRSDSIRVLGSNTFCLQKPVSTTYTMPLIVTDVSAMFVLITTFREEWGVGSNAACCCAGGSEEKSGTTIRFRLSEGKVIMARRSLLQASMISCSPVRNKRTSPGPS